MKKVLLFLFLLPFTFYSQSIEGLILDKHSGKGLQQVHISSEGTVLAISGSTGRYVFKTNEMDSGSIISFTFMGYARLNMTYKELEEREFVVELESQTEGLGAVSIDSRILLKPKLKHEELRSLEMEVYGTGSVLVGNHIYVAAGNRSFEESPILKELHTRADVGLIDLFKASQKDFTWFNYYDRMQVYDVEKDEWKVAPVQLAQRANHNVHFISGKLYILGGTELSANGRNEYLIEKIEVLDLEKDSLLLDPVNPHQAFRSASIVHEGNIIVMGGSIETKRTGRKIYTDKVHLFNPTTGLWFELKQMPTAKETQGVIIGDKIYLVGGFNDGIINEIESFDLNTGTWTKEADLPFLSAYPAVTVFRDIIYILDGSKIYTYGVTSRELREYRTELELYDAEMHYRNGKLFILGGYRSNEFSKKAAAGVYSIDLKEFRNTQAKTSFL